MVNNNKNSSPDMVRYDAVIDIIANNPKAFASEKDMAQILRCISNLPKYDLKPIADNITNNNTTINLVAESPKVKQLIEKIRENI